MRRNQSHRALRRLRQGDRNKAIRARTVDVQDDDLSQRKRIEKLWEQSINFFADSDDIGIDTKESE